MIKDNFLGIFFSNYDLFYSFLVHSKICYNLHKRAYGVLPLQTTHLEDSRDLGMYKNI